MTSLTLLSCRAGHLTAVLLLLATGPAHAAPAHQHGTAELMVAVEDREVNVILESPAANLLGFEHRPRTPEQRSRARALTEALESGIWLHLHSEDGQTCPIDTMTWETDLFDAASLQPSDPAEPVAQAERHHHHHHHRDHDHPHADITAWYTFQCTSAPASLSHDLFERFTGLEELRINLVTEQSQRALRQHQGRAVEPIALQP